MWRAFFLAVGISCLLLGGECLVIEKAVLADADEPPAVYEGNYTFLSAPAAVSRREYTPPDWAPWSLLAAGAVICLYSFTIPARVGGG